MDQGLMLREGRYTKALILMLVAPVLIGISVLLFSIFSSVFLLNWFVGGLALMGYLVAHVLFCVGLALLISGNPWVVAAITLAVAPVILVGKRAPEIYHDYGVLLAQDADSESAIEIESGSNIKLSSNVERIYARNLQYGTLAKNCADAWCFGFSSLSAPDSRSLMFWSEDPHEVIGRMSLNSVANGHWDYELRLNEVRYGNAKKITMSLWDANGRIRASRERYYRDDFNGETPVDGELRDSKDPLHFYEYFSRSGFYWLVVPPTISREKKPLEIFLEKNLRVVPQIDRVMRGKIVPIPDVRLTVSETRRPPDDIGKEDAWIDVPNNIEEYAFKEQCSGVIREVTGKAGMFGQGSWAFLLDKTSSVRVDGDYLSVYCSNDYVWFYAIPSQGSFKLFQYSVLGELVSAWHVGSAHASESSAKVKQANYWLANALHVTGVGEDISAISFAIVSDVGDETARKGLRYRADIAIAPAVM